MTGEVLKKRLLKRYKVLANVARKLNVSQQALNQTLAAADIKTGFIEKLAAAYGEPASIFFEDEHVKIIQTEGDNSPASDSGDVSVIVGDAILSEQVKSLKLLVAEKDARISELKERILELKSQTDGRNNQ